MTRYMHLYRIDTVSGSKKQETSVEAGGKQSSARRRYVSPKRRLTLNRLHGVISHNHICENLKSYMPLILGGYTNHNGIDL
jgi:hypothetical protein